MNSDENDTSLDPRDWAALRRAAHGLLDQALDHAQTARAGRVWTPMPAAMKAGFCAGLPGAPSPPEWVAEQLASLMPYGVGNTHPRFFGWVHGAGSPGNMLAEITAAAMNANLGGRDHGAAQVERQVIDWCREMMGFPESSGGLVTTGTSMATIIALKVARDRALDWTSRAEGLGAAPLVGYASEQSHACIARAFDLLGLGSDALRRVPVNADFTMNIAALRDVIDADRRAGLRPFLVVGTAGTVNTGAIDDLTALVRIARRDGLWLHVDGAFGASLMLSDSLRGRLAGLEKADSLAFDFHKWMQVNYAAGCVLVRDAQAQLRSFSDRPDYLARGGRGLAAGGPWPVDFGPELSREFAALRIWAHFLEHGTGRLARVVEANCAQAAWLGAQVEADSQMQLLAPVALNIVCFRMMPTECADPDRLNDEIVVQLQESGVAAPSTTRLNGMLAIRVNLTNHRTRQSDLETLLSACRETAQRLVATGRY